MDEMLKLLNTALPGCYSNAMPVKGCMMIVLYGLVSISSILRQEIFFYIRLEYLDLYLYHNNSAVLWWKR